ncbi:MAG: hypothetical protein AAF915_22095 [Cyanobacteria bacterium P01_D01_bin.50]
MSSTIIPLALREASCPLGFIAAEYSSLVVSDRLLITETTK